MNLAGYHIHKTYFVSFLINFYPHSIVPLATVFVDEPDALMEIVIELFEELVSKV